MGPRIKDPGLMDLDTKGPGIMNMDTKGLGIMDSEMVPPDRMETAALMADLTTETMVTKMDKK